MRWGFSSLPASRRTASKVCSKYLGLYANEKRAYGRNQSIYNI